jgi:WD40 repeat protein
VKKAHQDYIRSFSIHEEDNLLLTSSWDGTVKLWKLSDLSAYSTVFEIEKVNAATSYGVKDAFKGANITNLRNISEVWRNFFVELGAIDMNISRSSLASNNHKRGV